MTLYRTGDPDALGLLQQTALHAIADDVMATTATVSEMKISTANNPTKRKINGNFLTLQMAEMLRH